MTEEWIGAYNRKCAEFIGEEITEYFVETQMDLRGSNELMFHSDWNWIMEVIDKIDTIGQSGWMKNHAVIFVDGNPISLVSVEQFKRKEATIKAINQFIDWYNEHREL